MHKPLVTIISVHFNQLALTIAFLESLKQVSYKNTEVIIVDNGSVAEPIAPLINVYTDVHFIISQKNLGFAGGNNLGIAEANGDYSTFFK